MIHNNIGGNPPATFPGSSGSNSNLSNGQSGFAPNNGAFDPSKVVRDQAQNGPFGDQFGPRPGLPSNLHTTMHPSNMANQMQGMRLNGPPPPGVSPGVPTVNGPSMKPPGPPDMFRPPAPSSATGPSVFPGSSMPPSGPYSNSPAMFPAANTRMPTDMSPNANALQPGVPPLTTRPATPTSFVPASGPPNASAPGMVGPPRPMRVSPNPEALTGPPPGRGPMSASPMSVAPVGTPTSTPATSMGAPPGPMGHAPLVGNAPAGARPPMAPLNSMPYGGMPPPISSSSGQPLSGGPPPSSVGGPPGPMSRPPGPIGGPPGVMSGPPGNLGPPERMSGPPNTMGGPPAPMGSAPGPMAAPPPPMGGPHAPMGPPPSHHMAGPPGHMMRPPGPIGAPTGPPGPMAPPPMPGPHGVPPPTSSAAPSMGPMAGEPAPGMMGQPRPMGHSAPAGVMPGQAQQPRRLDPDQMPSPIQVIESDRSNRGGLFETGSRGLVPPLVTTNFICEDQGNVNPRFLRSSMYNVPISGDVLKQSHIPFVINVNPFARLHPREAPPPIVDLGQLGPVRCNRCKAYMSPNMHFIDGGRRFQCCFCSCTTEVPPEYFAHLDHTGRRMDTYDRPELCRGAYEFVATADYCRNNQLPNKPAFIFMIDVSYNSVKSGLVHLLCSRLKEDILVNLPKETGAAMSEIRVGFVTYARELHFYNVKGTLAQPQMLVVSDIQDVFVPILDGFLVTLAESESVIDSLLAQIPEMFADSKETEVVLGPVIQAGLDALKAAEASGKLFIFHSSLPIAEAPGKLKNRDDRKVLGTDKEKTVLTPQNPFYTKLGQECVSSGCGVDIFLFPNSYVDIASIAEVPRLTGGAVYRYPYFQADLDGTRLIEDLYENVTRPLAFDAVMRVRTSTGIRPVDFLGNFYMSNTTDVELAIVDSDKTVTVEIKHDDKLNESEGAIVQVAVLYTSVGGQRRLRILNLALNVCTQLADLFRSCELDTLVNFMAKNAIRQTVNQNPKATREHLMNICAQTLACYRRNCASPSSVGQLILPECMKLLPVYCNCVLKSVPLVAGGEISTDERAYLMHVVNAMTVPQTAVFFYPRLFPLEPWPVELQQVDVEDEGTSLPSPIRCSYERLADTGVYLLENGLVMFLWVGMNVAPEWIQQVLGAQSAAQIDIDKTTLQDLDNPLSRRVRGIVRRIRSERHLHMKLHIARQGSAQEELPLRLMMAEDASAGKASYADFLVGVHQQVTRLVG